MSTEHYGWIRFVDYIADFLYSTEYKLFSWISYNLL